MLFKKKINKNYDFIGSKNLSAHEKSLCLEKMLVINPILLSQENFEIFSEKKAIVHQGQAKKIRIKKKPTKISPNFQMI